MEYKTIRARIIIPEHDRNVQKMADHLMTIEDRKERNKQAQYLIEIIGNLNPKIRNVPDFKHELWDRLFIMSNFTLDVDSPYPKPSPQTFKEKPELLSYPETSNKYRHYGNIMKKMLKYTVEQPQGEYRENLKQALANHMKKTYLIWNKDTVEDSVILKEMNDITEGKLDLKNINLIEKQDLMHLYNDNRKYYNRKRMKYKSKN